VTETPGGEEWRINRTTQLSRGKKKGLKEMEEIIDLRGRGLHICSSLVYNLVDD